VIIKYAYLIKQYVTACVVCIVLLVLNGKWE